VRKSIKYIYQGAERQPQLISDENSPSVLTRLSQEVIRQAHLATAVHIVEVTRKCDSQEMNTFNHNGLLLQSCDGKGVQI